jgi:PAS domain S-box-containing protein
VQGLTIAAVAYALVAAALTLAGWATGLTRLTDWGNSGITMKANPALLALCAAIALLLVSRNSPIARFARTALALFIASVALLTLFEHFSGRNLGIDTLLCQEPPGARATVAPGRMGIPASCSFIFLSAALLCMPHRKTRAFAVPLVLVPIFATLLSLTGYLYGAEPMYTLPRLTAIAMQTATIIFALAVGVLAALPERQPMALLRSQSAAGLFTRTALPGVLLFPLLIGWLRLQGQQAGLYDNRFGAALRTLSEIALFAALLWTAAAAVRRYEARFLTTHSRLTGVLGSITDVFFSLDPQGRFTFLNDQALQRFARSRDSLLGKPFAEAFPDAPANDAYARLHSALHDRTPAEYEVFNPASGRWFFEKGYPLPDGGLAVYSQDITERKQAEQLLLQTKQHAEAANLAKDRFLAVLSHELRTPLTPVLVAVTTLEARTDLPPDARDDVRMARRNVELECKLIDDLLDLNRVINGKLHLQPESLDLHELIAHVCDICSPAALDKHIRLHCELDPASPCIHADPARLRQVLWNLLNNAIKFTPAGGRVLLKTQLAPDTFARITIQDNGVGMTSDVLARIFNAFEQGEARITRQFGGLGLGLAISKLLVEQHHGSIRAASDGPGKGATFVVELPAALPNHVPPAPPAADPPPAPRAAPIRILLVEDHPDTASVLTKVLTANGHAVHHAPSVARALALADQHPFDLLVSDIGLPDATGFDLMRQLKARYPINGIAMSGFGMEEDVRNSAHAGFSEHLVKPLNLSRLEQAIRRHAPQK